MKFTSSVKSKERFKTKLRNLLITILAFIITFIFKKTKKSKGEITYILSKGILAVTFMVLVRIFIEEHKEFFNLKNSSILIFFISGVFVTTFKIKLYFKKENNQCGLYSIAEPKAKKIKILIQMAIGIGVAFLIVIEMISLIYPEVRNIVPPKINILISKNILEMVSLGLGAATAIELAYMLFTDGPDEAVDPLIMGIASFVLAQLSDSNFEIQKGIGIFFIVILIPILFIVKNKFLTK